MKASFYSKTILLGEIDFSEVYKYKFNPGMEGITGDFFPNENYELIKKDIQDWNDVEKQDFSIWYSYKFNVQLENGYFLLPEGGYEIFDFKDFPEEPLQINCAGINGHFFEDYFVRRKPFLCEPWRKITIEEKFRLEEKYKQETDLKKRLTFFHNYLREPVFSALAINEKAMQVLYALSDTKSGCFAKVDFAKRDEKNNPQFEFYNWFDEFVKSKTNE